MINLDRALRARILPLLGRTRTRVIAAAAVGAIGLTVGVSALAGAGQPATQPAEVVAGTKVVAAAPAAPAAKPAAKPAAPTKPAVPAKPAVKPAVKPAAKKVAKPVAKKKAATKAPSARQMHPRGIGGGQQTFKPTAEQMRNARAIVETGKKLGLPPRAWVIAVATSLQESTLRNIGNLGANNDHDSLGLFQQRPSSGWGSPKQIVNPTYASTQFYQGLVGVPGWNKLPLTAAAQNVQVSAYPDHYAKWEKQAGTIISGLHGAGPYAKIAH